MEIKHHKIGMERPLVCVSVTEARQDEIVKKAEKLAGLNVDIMEWRIDWYEAFDSQEKVRELAKKLSRISSDMILLCTFRSKPQGGQREITREEYTALALAMAEDGYADIIDVEVCELLEPAKLILQLQERNSCVLASDHDFSGTPQMDIMTEKLLYMKYLGADIAKLAVMPRKKKDVLALLEASIEVSEQYPQYPWVTMAMGEMGLISRIGGIFSGSCITFGADGKTSAPGQMPFQNLTVILEKIQDSV